MFSSGLDMRAREANAWPRISLAAYLTRTRVVQHQTRKRYINALDPLNGHVTDLTRDEPPAPGLWPAESTHWNPALYRGASNATPLPFFFFFSF